MRRRWVFFFGHKGNVRPDLHKEWALMSPPPFYPPNLFIYEASDATCCYDYNMVTERR